MSLGLRLYLAAARRTGGAQDRGFATRRARPAGKLVWFHISGAGDVAFVQGLIQQLAVDLAEVSFLVTSPANLALEASFQQGCNQPCLHIPSPADTPNDAAAFIDHWQPSVTIWTGSILRPALLLETHARSIPLLMMNAQNPASINGAPRMSKGVIRDMFDLFDHILTNHESTQKQLVRQGANHNKTLVGEPVEDTTSTLFWDDRDRDDMAQTLSARPVWLAAYTNHAEDALIANAHRTAMRLSHRLLLILSPKDAERGASLAQSLTEDGWLVARRSLDQEPDEHVQILIADTEDEMGLWLRLAPVCFLGNSLGDGATGCAPGAASALGSAILHGPNVSDFNSRYARLDAANAARLVQDETSLASAVQDLLSPDKAAAMAHAGWEISTSGAEAMERTMALIYDALNQNEAA